MSIKKAQSGLLKRLRDLVGDANIAKEGLTFNAGTTPYYKVQFRIDKPSDPTLGTQYYRDNMEFQVFVMCQANKGTGQAMDLAESVRYEFRKGTTIVNDGIITNILETPQIGGAVVLGEWIMCPVLIPTITEVFSA